MKIKSGILAAGILVTLFTSCKHEIDKTIISGFNQDNKGYSDKVAVLQETNSSYSQDKDKIKSDFMKGLAGKDLAAFQKDKALNTKIQESEQKIMDVAAIQKGRIDSLIMLIAENDQFISSLSTTDKSEEQVTAEWGKKTNDINSLIMTIDDLNKKIMLLEQEYRKLLESVKQTYYPKKPAPKTKKKK